MYFFKHFEVELAFQELGYPSYLIYPLALAKLLAVIAIISNKSRFLKNLAYAGLFYNFTLAFFAHVLKSDGAGLLAFLGILLIVLSYTFDKILRPNHKAAFDL